MNLTKGEKLMFKSTGFTVDAVWHGGGVITRYDLMTQNGQTQTRDASIIHQLIEDGEITFVK